MRPAAVAAVSLASAVVGAIAVLLVGASAGWVGDSSTETVVAPRPVPALAPEQEDGEPAAVRSSARPLPGNGFDPALLYAARSPGVVTVHASFGNQEAQGSGFVASTAGHILTNSHVITDAGEVAKASQARAAREVFVEFKDGERVPATVVGWDIFDDVGLLKVDPAAHALAPVPLGDSSRVVVGEPVAAIGSPFGEVGSLAVGVVSATRRSISALTSDYLLVDAIQTDAPINRGNSGGPLFDARGRVIGINAQIRSNSGTAEGVGFAVPINSAKRSMAQLIESGRVSYAYVGISTDDLTPGLARKLGLRVTRGALIVRVDRGPGRAAGLRAGSRAIEVNGREFRTGGDVVLAIDGEPVRSGDDLVRIVAGRLSPGQVVTFAILRGSARLNVPVRLGERPADSPAG
ncbi:MAG: S1C family serine protease [Gaiellaceae bacterium]